MSAAPPPIASPALQSHRRRFLAGGVTAGLLFGVFLIGVTGIVQAQRAITDNWLIILLKINLGLPSSALADFSVLDAGLMVLFGILMASIYPALKAANRPWALIVVVLPFLGLPVFIATGIAGRSAVLLAGLVSSFLSLRSRSLTPPSSWAGILASAFLLFVGDFGTALFPPSTGLAVLIGIGYILWALWLLLVAQQLLRRNQ